MKKRYLVTAAAAAGLFHAAGAQAQVSPGTYQLTPSYAPSECLETIGGVTAPNGTADTWNCGVSYDPNWTIAPISDGVYEIRQPSTGNCLTAAGNSFNDGNSLLLWGCYGQVGSRWNVVQSGPYFTLHSIDNPAKCVDVNNWGGTNGTKVQVWDCSGGTNQQFTVSGQGGIAATISSNGTSSNFVSTVVVTNKSNGTASNWQVGVALASTVNVQNVTGAEGANIGGTWTFNPGLTGTTLAPGASVTFQFSGTYTGTFGTPYVASVDGETNGAGGASPDGIDHIARAAASGALGVAFSYENNKLANTGDANYAYYDGLIWSAQSYIISNGQIAFDPNAPGYKFVPQQAMAALAVVQQDPSVAEYLVTGLQSCFQDTSGQQVYYFNAGMLKGFPTTLSGTVAGAPYNPPPYNPIDSYTVSSKSGVAGSEIITINETGSTSDMWFGTLTTVPFTWYGSPSSILSKFHGGNQTMCSPFNGPGGGTSNPYLVITLNGQQVGARQQQVGVQCQNGCSSTITLDPIAYTIPGPQYDSHNNLLGPQNNPFTLDPTDVYSDPSHYMQFSTNPAAQFGTFSKQLTLLGQPVEKWLACGMNGSGC